MSGTRAALDIAVAMGFVFAAALDPADQAAPTVCLPEFAI